MPKARWYVYWSTKSEREFIDGLGLKGFSDSGLSRRDLLRGYVEGLDNRTDWDNLDRDAIRIHAHTALLEMS